MKESVALSLMLQSQCMGVYSDLDDIEQTQSVPSSEALARCVLRQT